MTLRKPRESRALPPKPEVPAKPKGAPRGKPLPPTGRPKGVQNHYTKDMREAIREAFVNLGGAAYLEKLGRTNPALFVSLLAKTVPQELKADVNVVTSTLAERLAALRKASK
jgi:hypothetical protein